MKKLLLPLLIVCLALIGLACNKSIKPRLPQSNLAELSREIKLPLPIAVGERLVYEVRVSRFPLYAAAGDVTFEYLGPTTEPKIKGATSDFGARKDERFLHFRAGAVSKGFIVKTLLGIDVDDRFEVLVNAHDFATRGGVKEIQEGKKHFLQTFSFDREKLIATYQTSDLNKPEQPAVEKALNVARDAQDLLSAFYFVRLQRLKEGDVLRFPLAYEATQYEFELIVHGTEAIENDLGKFKTIKLEPKLFGKGRLIQREGEMTMWVTDDERHLPVKLVAKTSNATITANLTKMAGSPANK